MNQKGIAMVTAIVLALVVSATAAVVLSLTFRRFELSAFRTDHAVATGSSEAGFQYSFARLDKDRNYNDPNFPGPPNGFKETVQRKRFSAAPETTGVTDEIGSAANAAAEYVVTCHRSAMPTADLALDEQPVAQRGLHMGALTGGGKHVIVRIRFYTAVDIDNIAPLSASKAAILTGRPYRVRSDSTFGTGGS